MDQPQTAAPPATSSALPKPKRRWWRLRFSLGTLLLGVLAVGSGMGLRWRWERQTAVEP